MRWLLHLYPPAWRRRYRHEVEAYLETESRRLRTALDLIAGAVDAWLNPKWIPDVAKAGGGQALITASRCGSVAISTADAGRSAAWMIGTTLVLTGLAVGTGKMKRDPAAR